MTSCAVSEHLTSNRNVMQTNVELSKNNFQVIGTAQGSATVIRVFGIGGLSLKAIRANAYAEMVKNANLSGSQALINVNTEVKQRGVAPFYWKTVITTCGQVIEFISTEEQVSEHHAGTAKRFAPRTAETTMAEEIIVVDPIAKIKSNTMASCEHGISNFRNTFWNNDAVKFATIKECFFGYARYLVLKCKNTLPVNIFITYKLRMFRYID